jgi:hypothetical protein
VLGWPRGDRQTLFQAPRRGVHPFVLYQRGLRLRILDLLKRLPRLTGPALTIGLLVACVPGPAPAPPPPPLPTRPGLARPTPSPATSAPTSAPSPAASLAQPPRLEDVPKALVDFLNASPANRGRLGPILTTWSGTIADRAANRLVAADVDGDGVPELVAIVYSTRTADQLPNGAPGVITVLRERGGRFESVPVPGGLAEQGSAGPILLDAKDLNRDGAAELAFRYKTCGASTCTDQVVIVGRDGQGLKQLTPDNPSMAGAAITLADTDGDGIAELQLKGGLMGSVGAGLQRERTETYRWNGTSWALAETTFAPSNERYFAIVDAGRAFDRKDYSTALRLYRAAANDDNLADSKVQQQWDPGPDLRAYARFRLVLTDLVVGQEDDARATIETARQRDKGSPLLALTDTLWNNYSHTASVKSGCGQVVAMVAADPQPYLRTLNGYGYANPELKPADLCQSPVP